MPQTGVSTYEAAIMDDFNKPGSLAPIGLYLGGTKYMVIQGESDLSIVPFLLSSRVVIQAFTLVGQSDLGLKKPSKMESATTRE
ncbi:hypothetical protein JHK86_024310 [Glycine max]|nr:hypothetical protein JHK86_024310 [Glycine max]